MGFLAVTGLDRTLNANTHTLSIPQNSSGLNMGTLFRSKYISEIPTNFTSHYISIFPKYNASSTPSVMITLHIVKRIDQALKTFHRRNLHRLRLFSWFSPHCFSQIAVLLKLCNTSHNLLHSKPQHAFLCLQWSFWQRLPCFSVRIELDSTKAIQIPTTSMNFMNPFLISTLHQLFSLDYIEDLCKNAPRLIFGHLQFFYSIIYSPKCQLLFSSNLLVLSLSPRLWFIHEDHSQVQILSHAPHHARHCLCLSSFLYVFSPSQFALP